MGDGGRCKREKEREERVKMRKMAGKAGGEEKEGMKRKKKNLREEEMVMEKRRRKKGDERSEGQGD